MLRECPLFILIVSFALTISTNFSVRFPRSNEKAWQGVPPQSRSGASISPEISISGILFISPTLAIFGYFSDSTLDGKSAISENHLKESPNGSQATEAASIPEQILPTVLIIFSKLPRKNILL